MHEVAMRRRVGLNCVPPRRQVVEAVGRKQERQSVQGAFLERADEKREQVGPEAAVVDQDDDHGTQVNQGAVGDDDRNYKQNEERDRDQVGPRVDPSQELENARDGTLST